MKYCHECALKNRWPTPQQLLGQELTCDQCKRGPIACYQWHIDNVAPHPDYITEMIGSMTEAMIERYGTVPRFCMFLMIPSATGEAQPFEVLTNFASHTQVVKLMRVVIQHLTTDQDE